MDDTHVGKDFLASELLKELKEENQRKDIRLGNLHKVLTGIVAGAFAVILIVIGGFLWYLDQYDYMSTSNSYVSATGVYALIDSEGNVVADDLTPEDIERVMEVLGTYGDSTETANNSTSED